MIPLETSWDAYLAIRSGVKVIWKTEKGDFEITEGDPIAVMIYYHLTPESKILDFYRGTK